MGSTVQKLLHSTHTCAFEIEKTMWLFIYSLTHTLTCNYLHSRQEEKVNPFQIGHRHEITVLVAGR